MIKKFIKRLLGKGAAEVAAPGEPAAPVIPLGARVEIPAAEHRIDAKLLDANAVRVVRTLKDAGHEAYIVGGAVRDLLVGLVPKDFDVATNATPEQVKALFRRAFIIGRRFRLVHVVFGRGREHETIEVSTFRAYLDAAAAEQVAGNEKTAKTQIADKTHVVDAEGRVLRDNVWGPQIEDAARRDFTVNAMYYDPVTETVVDYHGGLADSRARVLRMIGDAATRYREDPVRIIRIVRFAAKLGFALDPGTEKPIRAMTALLANVPISRLFDEMVKLMQTGHALASIEQMKRFGLIGQGGQGIFPVLDAALAPAKPSPARDTFVRLALQDTDRRVAEGRAVAPSFMLACLLWHDVQERWTALREQGEAPLPALQQAVDAVFDARIGDISGRGKLAADMREIWLMQPRFERRSPSSALALAGQPRFRAGYDFLRLRADCGDLPTELADWWEDFHLGSDDERQALLDDLRSTQPARARRVPAASGTADAARPAPPPAAEGEAAPRKRRRRRRRPAGARDEGAPTGRRMNAERVFVGLGANLGDAHATVLWAAQALARLPGVAGQRLSSMWRSAPFEASGPDFYNAVVELMVSLEPLAMLHHLQALERRQGRERPFRNAPRTLDLDLLLFGDRVIATPELTVPHPRMHQRAFVLRPLLELAPDLMHPQLGPLSRWLAATSAQTIEKLP